MPLMYSKNSSYSLAISAESSMITPVSMFCLLSLEKLAKPLQARHTGPLSRDLALAFSYPVRVDAAHRPRETPARKSPSPKWDHAPK